MSVERKDRPNVIVIMADDLGYGDLGCYGQTRYATPHLDRMAAEGARFTQFNSPCPVCAPSRSGLLTGRYPLRCGLIENPTPDGKERCDRMALPATEVTIADLFRAAGYATGMIGKWHLGHRRPEYLPTHRGFDEYRGIPYSNDMRPVRLLKGTEVETYPVDQTALATHYTAWCLDFVDRHHDRPFFLHYAPAAPHKPLSVSAEFAGKTGAGLYGDTVAELDASVGRLLEHLRKNGLDRNTLVFFTSDHGPWFGGSTGGLRGMKASTFEGGFRVPMLTWWPGTFPAATEIAAPAITMDIFTTALKAAHIAPPPNKVIDGCDLGPLLRGETDRREPAFIFGQTDRGTMTVRDPRWKLHLQKPWAKPSLPPGAPYVDPKPHDGVTIIAPGRQYHPSDYPGLETGDEPRAGMLFDLANDPAEQHDVAARFPDEVNRLRAAAAAMDWRDTASTHLVDPPLVPIAEKIPATA
ncbi:MAG: sulfatase [Opitutaceae bacterium]